MADAIFVSGNPTMVDHTAEADIDAGEVVVVGGVAMIAHLAIANGADGSLAVQGGVYDCVVAGNYAKGSQVYWDDSANNITTTSTNNAKFGLTVETAAAANDVIEVFHDPNF